MAVARSLRQNTSIEEHFDSSVLIATVEQGRELFDREARSLLDVSGEEFLRRWDAGEYDQVTDVDLSHRLNSLLMLLPFVRSIGS
jgi:hypothetical protein